MTWLNSIGRVCVQAIVICALGVATAEVQAAPDLLPGAYRCSAYNVSGGGGSCRTMPSLVLHPDGSYQFSSTRGRWSVNDGKLVLSEAQIWGAGEILGSNVVRFEYDYRGWHHVVTWLCQECAPTSESPPMSNKVADSGSGLQELMNSVNELGKAFDGAPPQSYPTASPGYSTGGPPASYPSGYPSTPAPTDPRAVQGYGPPPDVQVTAPPSQQPKCHPLIPKYSQPGCVE